MKKHFLFGFLVISSFLLFNSCEELVPEGNVVYVEEHITTPTVWESGNIYVVTGLGLTRIEALLTIEPDVIVKFDPQSTGLNVRENGNIVAVHHETASYCE